MEASRLLGRCGEDLDPAQHLLDELHHAAAVALVLGELVADLDDAGRLWSTAEGVAVKRAWGDERDRRARLAKVAIDVGVHERMVRLSEQQARLLADAVRGILVDAGVDPASPEVRGIVRRHLSLAAERDRHDQGEVTAS